MKPEEVQLTNEEKAAVVFNGIIKGCKNSMWFWFILWELVAGYLWFPHMHVIMNDKHQGDFTGNVVLAAMCAFGTLLAGGIALVIICAVCANIYDYFKKHIDEEAESFKKNLIDNGERKILK